MLGKMGFKRLRKYVCCTLNVTIGARIIGFIGIMISVFLITVLLNDTYFDKERSYNISRKTALAFGLDWQHIHWKASTAPHNDPEGKKISMIVIFYSFVFLLLNLILCLGTITGDWRCAAPWLVCELLGCLSKFGALIYHLCYDQNNLSAIFITGSILYIVIMVWWWVVVFAAQLSWRHKDDSVSKLELYNISAVSKESQETDPVSEKIRYFKDPFQDSRNMDSPGPYYPNNMYALI